jgi:soluble lytic murein transglycosylase-like protein
MKDLNIKIANSNGQTQQVLRKPLARHLSQEQKRRLATVSEQFEGLLTSLMLKSMFDKSNGLFGKDSYGGDYFQSIFEMQLGDYIARNKSLGIAKQIYRNVTGEEFDPSMVMRRIHISPLSMAKFKNKTTKDKTIQPSVEALERLSKYENIINAASQKFGVRDSLIKSIILTESAAKENAVSKANAKGLMQLMDATAESLGIKDIFNPVENIFGGTKYLSSLFGLFDNNLDLALAAYNAGPENVKKHNGIPPFEETKNYVERVKAYLNYFGD